MTYTQLDDTKLVQMYENDVPMPDIRKEFGVTNGTIYRHLRAKGVDSNRKKSIPWTNQEESDLVSGRKEGLTGTELYERIPPGHPQQLRHTPKITGVETNSIGL